jgi:hypothetical protein
MTNKLKDISGAIAWYIPSFVAIGLGIYSFLTIKREDIIPQIIPVLVCVSFSLFCLLRGNLELNNIKMSRSPESPDREEV